MRFLDKMADVIGIEERRKSPRDEDWGSDEEIENRLKLYTVMYDYLAKYIRNGVPEEDVEAKQVLERIGGLRTKEQQRLIQRGILPDHIIIKPGEDKLRSIKDYTNNTHQEDGRLMN